MQPIAVGDLIDRSDAARLDVGNDDPGPSRNASMAPVASAINAPPWNLPSYITPGMSGIGQRHGPAIAACTTGAPT